MGGRGDRRRAVAAVLVALCFSASCHVGFTVGSGGSKAAAPTIDGGASFSEVVLHPHEMGPEWTLVHAAPLPRQEFTSGPCNLAGWESNVGGYSVQYSYHLQSDGLEQGHAVSSVFVAASDSAAAEQLRQFEADDYGPCARTGFDEDLNNNWPRGTRSGIDHSDVRRESTGLQLAGTEHVVTIKYHIDDTQGTMTGMSYHLFLGRYQAVLRIRSNTDPPFPPGMVASLLAATEARLRQVQRAS